MKFFDFSMRSSCQFSHSPNNTILRTFSFLSFCSKKVHFPILSIISARKQSLLFRVLISINKLTISIVAVEEGQLNIVGYDLGVET